MLSPVLMWTLLLAAARAACDNASVAASADAAERAFAEEAPEQVQQQAAQLDAELACLVEPLLPEVAAAAHRAQALAEASRAFQSRPGVAARSIRSMLAIQPLAGFPEAWLIDGTPLQQAWALAISQTEDAQAPIAAPAGARWLIDGAEAARRPLDRPVFAQCLWADQPAPAAQGWVAPGDPLPACPEPPPPPETCVGRWPRSRTTGAVATSAGAALLAGAAYALGARTNATFYDSDTPFEELKPLQTTTNALWGVSVGLGAAGLGLGLGVGVKGCLHD